MENIELEIKMIKDKIDILKGIVVKSFKKQSIQRSIINEEEALEMLGIGAQSLRRRIREDGLPCFWIKNAKYFSIEEIEAWIKSFRKEEKEVDYDNWEYSN